MFLLFLKDIFLVEILKRKMKVALEQSKNIAKFEDNCLLALSSLYGIELMEDNIGMLVMNVLQEFISDYLGGWLDIDVYCNKKLLSTK